MLFAGKQNFINKAVLIIEKNPVSYFTSKNGFIWNSEELQFGACNYDKTIGKSGNKGQGALLQRTVRSWEGFLQTKSPLKDTGSSKCSSFSLARLFLGKEKPFFLLLR